MPRVARFVIPGYAFHITHRGNNKEDIFMADEDRRRYLNLFEEAKQKHGMRIMSYCLMNNHVHFIAFADHKLSFAKTINTVHTRYAQFFNQKYSRVGHLWQGRYYSCILDEPHLLAAIRYVERNPVRALMVQKPDDWVWSSARERLNSREKGIISLEETSSFIDIQSWKDYIYVPDNPQDLVEIRKQTLSLRAWAEDNFKELIEKEHEVKFNLGNKGRPRKNRDIY